MRNVSWSVDWGASFSSPRAARKKIQPGSEFQSPSVYSDLCGTDDLFLEFPILHKRFQGRLADLFPIFGCLPVLDPVLKAFPEGLFFKDKEPFFLMQVNLSTHLQVCRGFVIRIAGQDQIAALGFYKTEG